MNPKQEPAKEEKHAELPWTLSPHTRRVIMSGEVRIGEANVPNAALIVHRVNGWEALAASHAQLETALHKACSTIHEARLQVSGLGVLSDKEAASLLGRAESDYQAALSAARSLNK